jgi:arylsulfatase A-like enzyme
MALFFTDYSLTMAGLRDDRWKLIHELHTGRDRLFDLRDDPAERRDLTGEHPERVAAYRQHLRRWVATQREHVLRSRK